MHLMSPSRKECMSRSVSARDSVSIAPARSSGDQRRRARLMQFPRVGVDHCHRQGFVFDMRVICGRSA